MSLPYNFDATRPRAQILMQGPNGRWIKVNAVIDSGNDVTLLRRDVGAAMGLHHQCSENNAMKVAGIAGMAQNYCLHKVLIRIGNSKPIQVAVGVGDVRENLLGRHDIFNKFRVTFEANRVVFTSTASYAKCCNSF